MHRRELCQRVQGGILRPYVTRTTLARHTSHPLLACAYLNATCIAFSSADDCFIIFLSSLFFLFTGPVPHLQTPVQERTAPTSVSGLSAAVRYPYHPCFGTQAIPCLPACTFISHLRLLQVLIMTAFYPLPPRPFLFTLCCILRILHRRELRQRVHGSRLRRYVTRTTLAPTRKPSSHVCLLLPSYHLRSICFQL